MIGCLKKNFSWPLNHMVSYLTPSNFWQLPQGKTESMWANLSIFATKQKSL